MARYSKIGEYENGMKRIYRFDKPLAMDDYFGCPIKTADVAVSDAYTHKERLVFPVVKARKNEPAFPDLSEIVGYRAAIKFLEVEGRSTDPFGGGNDDAVEPDERYSVEVRDGQDG